MPYTIEELKLAQQNFKFIRNKFTRLQITFKSLQDAAEAEEWVNVNTKNLVLTDQWWAKFNSGTTIEPSMEEILASIRRIISEDGEATVSRIFYFLDTDDLILFKLRWM